jgi:hypothetical protein
MAETLGTFHKSNRGQQLVFWLTVAVLGISLGHALKVAAR